MRGRGAPRSAAARRAIVTVSVGASALVVAGCSASDELGAPATVAEAAAATTTLDVPSTTSPESAPDETAPDEVAPDETALPETTVSDTVSATVPASDQASTSEPRSSIDDVRLNELQVIGSHNSYHLAPEGELQAGLAAIAPTLAAELDYTHRTLTEQLDVFGIRQFEIDVHADPDGGRYARRAGLEVVGLPAESGIAELDEPGFKVLHIQDVDFRTTCLTLVACLGEIEDWSTAHPTHVPIHVMIEVKSETIEEIAADAELELPDLGVVWTVPLTATVELLRDLEDEVLSVFDRERIIVPDDVRGEFETLPLAIAGDGWPTLGESRGKIMLSLVNRDAAGDLYRTGAPALEGRLFFTHADPGAPDAAIVRFDDPVVDADSIARALAAGYLVRTRSDETSMPGDDVTRPAVALASGAQYVSTDVYEDVGRGFVVRLPGGDVVRCNPVTASARCDDSDLTE